MDVFGTSELALRVPSLVAVAATAALLLLFVRRFFGAEAAATASLLYLVSPAQTVYATEGRSFALIGLLCLASFALYLSLFARPRWRTALALGVVNAAALWTHYTIAFAWLAQALCAPLLGWRRDERRALVLYVASQLLALVLFAPLARAVVTNLPDVPTSWLPPPDLATLARIARDLAGSRSALRAGIVLVVAYATWRVLWSRQGAADGGSHDARRLVVVACWAVVPIVAAFVVSQRSPILHVRYELYAGLGWIVAIAAVLAHLPWSTRWRAVAALTFVVLAIKPAPDAAYRDPAWREIASVLRDACDDARPVAVVLPEADCIPLAYYAAPDLLPHLFAPDGSYGVFDLQRRLAAQRIVCGERDWSASSERGTAARVLLIATDPETGNATRIADELRARGLAVVQERRLGNKAVRFLERASRAPEPSSPRADASTRRGAPT
jgi:hypothetical protein